MLAQAIRLSGALNTDFLSFCHASFCHLSLSRVSVSYISLCCVFFFLKLNHAIFFCWGSIHYVSFFHDSTYSLSLLGTSTCCLSLVTLVLPNVVCLLCFRLIGQTA